MHCKQLIRKLIENSPLKATRQKSIGSNSWKTAKRFINAISLCRAILKQLKLNYWKVNYWCKKLSFFDAFIRFSQIYFIPCHSGIFLFFRHSLFGEFAMKFFCIKFLLIFSGKFIMEINWIYPYNELIFI